MRLLLEPELRLGLSLLPHQGELMLSLSGRGYILHHFPVRSNLKWHFQVRSNIRDIYCAF